MQKKIKNSMLISILKVSAYFGSRNQKRKMLIIIFYTTFQCSNFKPIQAIRQNKCIGQKILIIIFYAAIHCSNLKPVKTQKTLIWVFYISFSTFPTDTVKSIHSIYPMTYGRPYVSHSFFSCQLNSPCIPITHKIIRTTTLVYIKALLADITSCALYIVHFSLLSLFVSDMSDLCTAFVSERKQRYGEFCYFQTFYQNIFIFFESFSCNNVAEILKGR